jgi:hypothetical protein
VSRKPSLTDYDRSADASPQARQARRAVYTDNREPSTKGNAIGMFHMCWCGQPYPHGWPGKNDGKTTHGREMG